MRSMSSVPPRAATCSTAPWTYPAVVSLLSGLYPQQHGADGHPSEQLLSRIDPELPQHERDGDAGPRAGDEVAIDNKGRRVVRCV